MSSMMFVSVADDNITKNVHLCESIHVRVSLSGLNPRPDACLNACACHVWE